MMMLGKSLDYFIDLQAVMETYMIDTPDELKKRLTNFSRSGVWISTALMERLRGVLMRSIGDTRWCPHCRKGFAPEDRTSTDVWSLYCALFPIFHEETPLTDNFDEWNW